MFSPLQFNPIKAERESRGVPRSAVTIETPFLFPGLFKDRPKTIGLVEASSAKQGQWLRTAAWYLPLG